MFCVGRSLGGERGKSAVTNREEDEEEEGEEEEGCVGID